MRYQRLKNLFALLAEQMLHKHSTPLEAQVVSHRRFIVFFGVSVATCNQIWAAIRHGGPRRIKAVHLLWGLMFLKTYAVEEVHASIAAVDEKTFHFWVWRAIESIANCSLVCKHFYL